MVFICNVVFFTFKLSQICSFQLLVSNSKLSVYWGHLQDHLNYLNRGGFFFYIDSEPIIVYFPFIQILKFFRVLFLDSTSYYILPKPR